MSKLIHTPGPINSSAREINFPMNGDEAYSAVYLQSGELRIAKLYDRNPIQEAGNIPPPWNADGRLEANARLLAAAYNAFDSSARRLGCNAVELAEAMQDGALLVDVLYNADAILYHTPHLDKDAFAKVEAVLAKAGAS
jgi:hypothetical protein